MPDWQNSQAFCERRLAFPRCRSPSLRSALIPLRGVAQKPVDYHQATATLGNPRRKLAVEAYLLAPESCRAYRSCTRLWLPSAQNTDIAHHVRTSGPGGLRRLEELSAPGRP